MTYTSVPTPSARGRGVVLTIINVDAPTMRARRPSAPLVIIGASETFFMASTDASTYANDVPQRTTGICSHIIGTRS